YEAGVGDPFAPPYTIKEYDLQSDQSTQLYRIEPLYEKSTNDPTTYKTYSISVGYLADTDMPYVKAIDGLYALKGSSATKLLDMTSDTGVDYALSTQIAISQYSPSTNSTSYSLYELKTKKSTALLTDSATILCFTTK
ncbi:MAG: hypothetical protein ABIV43_01930, partial [Candidatus Saccharimonadales bacterium]